MTLDDANRVTKENRKNPEYHVVVAIRRQLIPQLKEGNDYETHQSSLLYVIVLVLAPELAQNTIVDYSVLRTNQEKPVGYVMHERKTKDCAGSQTSLL